MPSKAIDSDASQIGAALKSARERAGLSQVTAAKAVGIDSVTLSRYERGKLRAPRATLMALAQVYDEDPAALGLASSGLGNVPRGTDERVRTGPGVQVAQRRPQGRARAGAPAPDDGSAPRHPAPPILDDAWEPTPALRGLVPQRVYDVAISYCRRLAAAGLPPDEVEEAERLLIDPAYAKLNRRAKRELTEDEQIQIIDATWSVMQEVLSWKGVRA